MLTKIIQKFQLTKNIQPLNGVERGLTFAFTPNRFASLGVIHI